MPGLRAVEHARTPGRGTSATTSTHNMNTRGWIGTDYYSSLVGVNNKIRVIIGHRQHVAAPQNPPTPIRRARGRGVFHRSSKDHPSTAIQPSITRSSPFGVINIITHPQTSCVTKHTTNVVSASSSTSVIQSDTHHMRHSPRRERHRRTTITTTTQSSYTQRAMVGGSQEEIDVPARGGQGARHGGWSTRQTPQEDQGGHEDKKSDRSEKDREGRKEHYEKQNSQKRAHNKLKHENKQ